MPPRPDHEPVPERSNTRRGAACPETLKRPGGVQVGDPSGPDLGTRGNNEVQKTAQEYANSVRERRDGTRTLPERPGRHA
jgi:hypothetical protein